MYLNFEAIEELVVQIISNPFVSGPASIALFFSLFAIGSRRLDLSHGNGTIKGATIGYFRIALRMRSCMYGEVSLLKSQAFLLMTYFSFTVGASSTSSLMADATSCLQTLRLHSSSEINKLSSDRLEQTNLKRAFWGIYSMEKPYSLQEGLLPLIHGEYADHNISSLQSSLDVGTDLLGVYVRYAEVCSSILRQLHSQRHESRDCSVCCGRGYCEKSPASTLCRLEDSLMMWKTDFSLNFNVDNLSALSRVERRHRLAYITRFHFATIAIYSLPEIEATDMSKERRCESARQILNLSSHISWSDMCDNWELCSAISLATCIIATGIIQKASLAEAERSIAVTDNISTYNMYSHKTSCEIDIPYIGIAIGFFSRISLSTTHDFGNAAMELCSFALSLARC
ncbi:hypothetical protein COCMIDRAFT_105204 [Bipolaris oryzae ATCC 44560]|uniref:Xylanolytic transcriptional activator regulatory domain-containing protein n=1 Tax=Bipolaris oryzae ATCC 44560 TaxID=930090 RepID=W6YWA9_COCMI|nr:uncharacterized protein COCMIDRAFT_105204 [Bipolaris oryzae ATCC 44560]EUC41823.1 hypothetical protein COCMIDRAFT_105204 [Bipolaris oryzae ATCC 44560]